MGRRAGETRVSGVNACRALFIRRATDIIRVYLIEERVRDFGDLLSSCARLRLPYKIVAEHELEALTESRHHEVICIVARPRAAVRLEDLLRAPGPACLLGLVGVGNPHNAGAILRTAAHFGVRGVVFFGDDGPDEARSDGEADASVSSESGRQAGRMVRLPASAARTSEGGAEWLDLVAESDPTRVLRAVRAAGFTVAATSSHGGKRLYDDALPSRLLLLVGAEDVGLPDAVLQSADVVLSVPGTGQVESLNVAAATALILGEHWRSRSTVPAKTGARTPHARTGREAPSRERRDVPAAPATAHAPDRSRQRFEPGRAPDRSRQRFDQGGPPARSDQRPVRRGSVADRGAAPSEHTGPRARPPRKPSR